MDYLMELTGTIRKWADLIGLIVFGVGVVVALGAGAVYLIKAKRRG